jgi:hypothetical protein
MSRRGLALVNESRFSFLFFGENRKTTGKKYVRKCREETLGQVFRPAGKIHRLFSDIRQSYLISFCLMRACMQQMRYVIACDCIYRMPQMRDITCDKCDIGRMRQIRYLSHMRYRIAYTPSPPPPQDTNMTMMISPPSWPTPPRWTFSMHQR